MTTDLGYGLGFLWTALWYENQRNPNEASKERVSCEVGTMGQVGLPLVARTPQPSPPKKTQKQKPKKQDFKYVRPIHYIPPSQAWINLNRLDVPAFPCPGILTAGNRMQCQEDPEGRWRS